MRRWIRLALLALAGLSLVACTSAPGATLPPPTPGQATSPAEGSDAVEGWSGTIRLLCPMAQFDDYFLRSDAQEYGIQGATAQVQGQLEAIRCQPRTTIKVWGHLERETIDHGGQRIVVERLAVVESYPPPVAEETPGEESVKGWQGLIVPYCQGEVRGLLFEREDAVRFGVAAGPQAARDAFMRAGCEGWTVRIWGTLHKGVDGHRGTRIDIERVEKVS